MSYIALVTFEPERFRFGPVKLTDMKRTVIAALAIAALVVGFLIFVRQKPDTGNISAQPEEQSIEVARRPSRVEHNDTSTFLPAEPVVETPAQTTNWLARLRAGEQPYLTAEQADAYVTANKRSAESLLTAFRGTKDKAYLREALEKFPDDSKVNFVGYFDALLQNKADYTDDERRTILERFARSAPENSLPNYLAASDYFKSGESDKAFEQFRNAASKSSLHDYSVEFMQNAEEAYRQSGYPEAEAKGIAFSSLVLPHLSELKKAGVDLSALAVRYQQSGDETHAHEARELALHLADMLQNGSQQKFLINQLVGIAIERKVLGSLDPNSAYDSSGRTVQNRIDELTQTRKNFNANVVPMENILPMLTPADQSAYFDRIRIYGEAAAMKWAVGKYGN